VKRFVFGSKEVHRKEVERVAATMNDIARITGLGLATISKYLNGGNVLPRNKALIDDAVKELNFTVNAFARGLKTSRSHTIGVVIPEINYAFFTSIISYVTNVMRKRGYAVLVCDCRTDENLEKEMVGFLVDKRVDGILNIPTNHSGEHLQSALDRGLPIVLIDRMIPELAGKVSAVLVDNAEASRRATGILLDEGHRDVGIILGPKGVYTAEQRFGGYVEAHAQRGLQVWEKGIVYSDFTMEGGYAAMKALLSAPQLPSAVFVTNFEMTLGASIALNEMQIRIPEDVSFVCFDKPDLFNAIFPTVTSIRQPHSAIGESAANLLLSMLQADKEPIQHQVAILSTQLQPGTTVRPAPRSKRQSV
jgi:LacI family transcriptional regulator